MNKLTETDYNHISNVKTMLSKKFGSLIYEIYCYGSRVKEQKQDTDFDVLILTTTKVDWKKEDEISDVLFYYGVNNDILFDVRIFSKNEFQHTFNHMPFIQDVKSYGILVND